MIVTHTHPNNRAGLSKAVSGIQKEHGLALTFLHSCAHRFGRHLFASMIAMRVF